jgi:NodT family efflux transporter outer membrane factor (OMF) lipoprotein
MILRARHLALAAGGLPLLLAACAVGPDYVAPDPGAPEAWSRPPEGGLSAAPADPALRAAWWTTLGDPLLTRLVGEAAAGSPDVQSALARIDASRARRGVDAADARPALNASASASSGRGSVAAGASGARGESYGTGLDASWEIDLFGRVRRAVEAARADLDAAREDYGDVLVTLRSEVALAYVELRTLQRRLAVARDNLATQGETHRLTGWRADAGLVTALDVAQSRANLETSRAQVPSLQSQIAAAEHRLEVLLGRPPGALHGDLAAPAPIPAAPETVAVGVPADTLRRRPDVRRAERQLAAQTARIGEARARRFPSLSLTGSIGLEALNPGDLSPPEARTDSLRAGLLAPIFQGGALRRGEQVQDALAAQALATYRSAVLNALAEVEDALVAYAREGERRAALTQAADAARLAAKLARDQYASGLIDFGDVLTAERTRLSAEDALAQSRGQVTTDLIRLYKALGGGWTAPGGNGVPLDGGFPSSS